MNLNFLRFKQVTNSSFSFKTTAWFRDGIWCISHMDDFYDTFIARFCVFVSLTGPEYFIVWKRSSMNILQNIFHWRQSKTIVCFWKCGLFYFHNLSSFRLVARKHPKYTFKSLLHLIDLCLYIFKGCFLNEFFLLHWVRNLYFSSTYKLNFTVVFLSRFCRSCSYIILLIHLTSS